MNVERQRGKMDDNIDIISVEGKTIYACKKCHETSKRRFNLERHFRRFHEIILPGKMCCETKFFTKSDLYKHREKIHNEKKKYTKRKNQRIIKSIKSRSISDFYKHKEKIKKEKIHKQKEYTKRRNRKTSKTKSSEVEQRDTLEIHMKLSETQNNNENKLLLHENLSPPKKHFLHKWQENASHHTKMESNRIPLTSMENITSRRTAMKRASQKNIKKLNFFNLNKENVKVYNITDRSNEGIDKGLYSIIF